MVTTKRRPRRSAVDTRYDTTQEGRGRRGEQRQRGEGRRKEEKKKRGEARRGEIKDSSASAGRDCLLDRYGSGHGGTRTCQE